MPGERILVVDDDEVNRRLMRTVLEPLDYRIREVRDGEEALEAVRTDPPDLILLDVVMPRRGGMSVCRELKGDPRTRLIPIVMVTSLAEFPVRIQGLEAGVDDFLLKPFNAVELTTRVRALISLKRYTDDLESAVHVLESIALVVERRDRYTGDHCRRIGEYGAHIGRALGLDQGDIKTLYLGGVFHDLGKIAVADGVLNKPGPLSAEEAAAMRTHPTVGADLCQPLKTMGKVVPLIRHHHEKIDGSGYPDRLAGEEIPLLARIISVADVYDALATDRPYRRALPHGTCMGLLQAEVRRGWWDGELVQILDRHVRRSAGQA